MDMSAEVWPPVVPDMTNLPLDDPKCTNESCTAFYAAANASQEALPFDALNVYGHYTTWYYVAMVGLLTAVYLFHTWHDRKSLRATSSSGSRPSALQKGQALFRFFSYRHFAAGRAHWFGLPLSGVLVFLLATVLFMTLITFVPRPYYRGNYGYGSPPLAIRSGFTAFACIPILIALAGKANLVTILTGISHEKLNIVHRWVAWISFALAWAHTIPFFWISHTDGGYENVKKQFYMGNTGRTMWGGVPPLTMLALLCLLSLEPIRARFYEAFYQVHILLGITYFGLLFWHAGNVLDSWHYLYATMAVWLASWLARTFWYTQPLNIRNSWFEGAPAKVTPRAGDMTEIELVAPLGFKFTPMQHCFLRVPQLAWLGNHPFTICTSYLTPTVEEKNEGIQEYQQRLVFLARAHSGFTKKLASYAATHPDNQLSVWIEGPYGGISRRVELAYDHMILIAGGGGITAMLPWLSLLAQKVAAGALSETRVRRISLFWTVKDSQHFAWASQPLERYLSTLRSSMDVQASFMITYEADDMEMGITSPPISTQTPKANDKITSESNTQETTLEEKHPDIATLGAISHGRKPIAEYLAGLNFERRNVVIACGPASLRTDVANACAVQQKLVLKGTSQEIALHLEEFGW
ncbi:hypothetical protein LZ554_008877 [Drepanopeziza brunnea f. sp. 'monogermtubi']|nr:hypothetical protein LZ554_008877 [Drepanopeziza brunnea f. sp. 'monogermtubi']